MNVYVREYRKIERRTRRRDSFAWRYLPTLLVLAAVVVVGKIYVQSVAIRWSDRVVELRETARHLEAETDAREQEIARLSTREHVSAAAEAKLGMSAPSEADVVWLPVPEGVPPPAHRRTAPEAVDRGPLAMVGGWIDAFWQEEALALTSQ